MGVSRQVIAGEVLLFVTGLMGVFGCVAAALDPDQDVRLRLYAIDLCLMAGFALIALSLILTGRREADR